MNDDNQRLLTEASDLSDDNGVGDYVTSELRNYAASGQYQTSEQQNARKFPQYVAAIAATLSAVASGMVLAWTSPIISHLENGEYRNISINSVEMGWIGSFVSLGAMSMCFPFGILCDTIGRKSALLLLIIPYGIGWSLIIWAKSLFMLYCGRFITGMAAGAGCVGAPLYNSEIAHKDIRGSLGGYFQLMVTVGIFLAYLVGKYATIIQYTFVCGAVPFIFFILFVFQPESPMYSIKRMDVETARNSLKRLRGPHYNVDAEIEAIKMTLQNSGNSSVFNSFRKRATKKAFIIILALMFFQQMSGVNAVIFYTGSIFSVSGTKLDPQTATIIVGAFQVVATFISSIAVEKLGRRMLLMGSELMVAVSCACLSLYFLLKDENLVSKDVLNVLGLLPVTSLCTFIVMFAIGLGPIPWTISGELFTPEVKSFAISSAATLNWFLAFLITKFYLQLDEKFGTDVVFCIFGCLSLMGMIFCGFWVPETKGKTIEEVQRHLENSN